jgi:uncharacterized membrane protein
MRSAAATLCASCDRSTRTVRGLCPHCGDVKDAGKVPSTTRRQSRLSIWDDLDLLLFAAPGLLLLIIGVFVAATDILLVGAVVLIAFPIVAALNDL